MPGLRRYIMPMEVTLNFESKSPFQQQVRMLSLALWILSLIYLTGIILSFMNQKMLRLNIMTPGSAIGSYCISIELWIRRVAHEIRDTMNV